MVSRHRSIHWLAPATMIIAFLGGLLLAMGHHLFYDSIDHTAVPTSAYNVVGKSLSQQQFNTAVGTAFAFLVKAFLTVAISTAYIQVFWRVMKNNLKDKHTLAELDCAFSALGNFLGFFKIKIWWKNPCLLLLALVFWCVPIASVVTPATLSVETTLREPALSSMVQVPIFDFTSLDFVAAMEAVDFLPDGNSIYSFRGPSQPVQNIAAAVAALGQILPITPPAPNASWTLDFWGPALQCHNVEGAQRDAIWVNIWNSYNYISNSSLEYGQYLSLAWTPLAANVPLADLTSELYNSTNRNLPFLQTENDGLVLSPSAHAQSGFSDFDWFTFFAGPASLYVAILPGMMQLEFAPGYYALNVSVPPIVSYYHPDSNTTACDYTMIRSLNATIHGCLNTNASFANEGFFSLMPAVSFQNATLLRCDLLNTSYEVSFNYIDGIQDIQVSRNKTGITELVNTTSFIESLSNTRFSAFPEPGNCSALFQAQDDNWGNSTRANCTFDPAAARLLSYQGIWSAFTQFVEGYVQVGTNADILNISGPILETILAQTEELAFIVDESSNAVPMNDYQLQASLRNKTGWAFPGLANKLPSGTRGDLKTTLELLFENITISLLAEPYLQPNFSSPFAPPRLTNVTFPSYHNIYSYSWQTLWIAYGTAIISTAVAVSFGVAAIILSGASYSDHFSTIVRVSRTAEMSVDVKDNDKDGREPLPEYLAEAHFDMHG